MCAINQKSYLNINVEKIVIPPGCDVINIEINLMLLIKLFYLYDRKVKIKIGISGGGKESLI